MRTAPRLVWVLVLALLLPALPSVAATRLPTVVEPLLRTTALALGETEAAVDARDQLVGVTWAAGSPEVLVRWHLPTGWTTWEAAEPDDAMSPAERVGTVAGTEPLWRPTGADRVAVRVGGAAEGLSLVRVGDGTARGGGWDLSLGGDAAHAADGRPYLGHVGSRADWGADERLRRGAPSYASTVRAVVVHHTAGGNDYRPEDVPARIRADYAYHVQARGWSDLGYNVVVDKFGGIWEGRAGGLGRAVIGSHAAGFNTGTLGVSLLGDMTKATPTRETVTAMSRVAAYAAATWRFDPAGTVTLTSKGSPRYSSGTKVRLGRVHGHRETGKTACPGALQDRLGDIRAGAARLLGPAPKILSVTVTGAPVHAPTPMVVAAELDRSMRWAVEVHDRERVVVARATGDSTRPHLEWNGLRGDAAGIVPAAPGDYTWHVRADDGYHPKVVRSGAVQVGLPLLPGRVAS